MMKLLLSAATTAALLSALLACSGEQPREEGLPPPTTTVAELTTSTPTPDPTLSTAELETRDRAEAEQAWLDYWDTIRLLASEAPGVPESDWFGLMGLYAVEDAARQNVAALQDQRGRGLVLYGDLTSQRLWWQDEIAGSDLARIWECRDDSQTGLLDLSTGDKLTAGQANKTIEGELVRGEDGSEVVPRVVEVEVAVPRSMPAWW